MLLPDDLLAAESRAFFAEFADAFATPEQRASFARYGVGLMSEIDRKSIEPIAALFCKDAAPRCNGMHQTLHRFVSEVPWDDAHVRARGADYAVAALRAQAPLEVGIVDDTGVVKAGTKSVGVDRMYCGRIGKIENCQVAVGLAVANGIDAVAIDMELYLTHTWTSDPVRRAACKIPEEVEFRTKPQLGIMMLCEAAARGIRPEVIVADSDYGKAPYFREAIRDLDMHFAVGVHADQPVRRVKHGRAVGEVCTVHAVAATLDVDHFTEVRWREGSKGTLKGRFALVEVIAAEASDVPCTTTDRETIFLLIEW
jgi:SRSO17 transposase